VARPPIGAAISMIIFSEMAAFGIPLSSGRERRGR